jgi:SAM-dependent methyltransferase
MTLRVLQHQRQIEDARRELVSRGISHVEPQWVTTLKRKARRFGLPAPDSTGDRIKSWDVLSSVDFIRQHLSPQDPVLDIGCYSSELILALHDLGFSKLAGIDLNPKVASMKYADAIDYRFGNFLEAPYPDESFKAITAISVIEHGFDAPRLAREISRLLQPGGYFIASFDYWPTKIDTRDVKIFGLDWLIFSRQDVARFLEECKSFGLASLGDLQFDSAEAVIQQSRFNYTFAWMALEKRT